VCCHEHVPSNRSWRGQDDPQNRFTVDVEIFVVPLAIFGCSNHSIELGEVGVAQRLVPFQVMHLLGAARIRLAIRVGDL